MQYIANSNRYNEMIYNRCGQSGLLLPAISLGLWHNFGSVDSFERSKELLFKSFDLGITHFDLANNYGPVYGSAEETMGRILKNDFSAYRDELIISSKAGYDMWPGPYGNWGSKKYLVASLNQSLKRMNLDYVDIFYHHRPDPDTPLEETMAALDLVVRQGKALYVGISNYPAELARQAESLLRQMGTPCLIHQPRYNIFERWVESDLFDVLNKRGIGCIAFTPLAQGLLTNKYFKGIPEGSRMTREKFLKPEHLPEEKLQMLIKLDKVAQNRGQSLAQMAIAWILSHKEVTSVLIGASSTQQIEDNVESIKNIHFTSDELKEIDAIAADYILMEQRR